MDQPGLVERASRGDHSDATQQALLAIWQNLPMLRDPARFEAHMFRAMLVRGSSADEGLA